MIGNRANAILKIFGKDGKKRADWTKSVVLNPNKRALISLKIISI